MRKGLLSHQRCSSATGHRAAKEGGASAFDLFEDFGGRGGPDGRSGLFILMVDLVVGSGDKLLDAA
jgi:hypothetical protein